LLPLLQVFMHTDNSTAWSISSESESEVPDGSSALEELKVALIFINVVQSHMNYLMTCPPPGLAASAQTKIARDKRMELNTNFMMQ
jgi:hypothetical protein